MVKIMKALAGIGRCRFLPEPHKYIILYFVYKITRFLVYVLGICIYDNLYALLSAESAASGKKYMWVKFESESEVSY